MYVTLMGENPAAAVSRAIENPSALSLEDSIVLDSYLIHWGHAENLKQPKIGDLRVKYVRTYCSCEN